MSLKNNLLARPGKKKIKRCLWLRPLPAPSTKKYSLASRLKITNIN